MYTPAYIERLQGWLMAKVSKQLIIESAVRLFHESGYHATSMRDIAQELKIRKASLYHHFDSKEDILLTILHMGMDQVIAELEQITASDLDPAEKLRMAIWAHARAIADNPEAAAIFLREDRGLGEKYLTEYVLKRDRFELAFRTILKEGIDEGSLRPTDVSIAVQALLGMVNWMTRWYRPHGRLSAKEIADLFTDMFLDGIFNPERVKHEG